MSPHTGADDIHYEEVSLSEMTEEDGVYYYECPCGDMFEISAEEIAAGETVAHCPSCSLTLKVILPAAEPASQPEKAEKAAPVEGAGGDGAKDEAVAEVEAATAKLVVAEAAAETEAAATAAA